MVSTRVAASLRVEARRVLCYGLNVVAVDLADVADQLSAVSRKAEALCGELPGERLRERSAPDKWSVAECLTHLKISSEAYFPVWREAFAMPRPKMSGTAGTYRLDLLGRILIWSLEPPPKFKFSAPAKFQPIDIDAVDRVLPAFLDSQKQMLALIAEAKGLPVDRMKIRSPFNSRLTYSVWSSFVVTLAHQRRHLWQAERVAETILKN